MATKKKAKADTTRYLKYNFGPKAKAKAKKKPLSAWDKRKDAVNAARRARRAAAKKTALAPTEGTFNPTMAPYPAAQQAEARVWREEETPAAMLLGSIKRISEEKGTPQEIEQRLMSFVSERLTIMRRGTVNVTERRMQLEARKERVREFIELVAGLERYKKAPRLIINNITARAVVEELLSLREGLHSQREEDGALRWREVSVNEGQGSALGR